MAAMFEWNADKDYANRLKHGVSFPDAQIAFLDRDRLIAVDASHGNGEQRCFCLGLVSARVMTVRFTFRGGELSGSSAPDAGAKAGEFMKRHDGYTDEPIGPLRVIKDFLPPPDRLILKEDGVKVTISLSKRSVDFFKKHAKKSKIPYQRMIRRVLDEYTSAFSAKARRG